LSRLAESPLADKVKQPNILCAAVVVPRETMDAVASKRAYPSRRRQSPAEPARAKGDCEYHD